MAQVCGSKDLTVSSVLSILIGGHPEVWVVQVTEYGFGQR